MLYYCNIVHIAFILFFNVRYIFVFWKRKTENHNIGKDLL